MKERRERPIPFRPEMVKAILEDRKTQTRRILKNAEYIRFDTDFPDCPHGAPGDRLWVKETWGTNSRWDEIKPSELFPEIPGKRIGPKIFYAADYPSSNVHPDRLDRWRPSIFMPRWISRITLEITNVRVERLQEISEEDAKAEGITDSWPEIECNSERPFRDGYRWLWESINGPGSWEKNPFCWVLDFRKV